MFCCYNLSALFFFLLKGKEKFGFNWIIIVFISDQLSRLHMILKPFMLRRIKRDVENELSEKVSFVFIASPLVALISVLKSHFLIMYYAVW